MSFSGLKTAALNVIHNASQKGEQIAVADLCASFSQAVSDTLVPRAMLALEMTGYRKLAVAGGVAANSRIRADLERESAQRAIRLYAPPLSLCGDNGAMIGAQGYYEYLAGHVADQSLNGYATRPVGCRTPGCNLTLHRGCIFFREEMQKSIPSKIPVNKYLCKRF